MVYAPCRRILLVGGGQICTVQIVLGGIHNMYMMTPMYFKEEQTKFLKGQTNSKGGAPFPPEINPILCL